MIGRTASALASLLLTMAAAAAAAAAAPGDAVQRGEYLFRVGGCYSCHTDPAGGSAPLAGGRPLKTPFGTFYSPNITPDPETGIGRWSDEDFLGALKRGIRPDGAHYFPVFPFTSYTRMRDEDALAIKAYLFSQPAVRQPNRPHDVSPPFSWRFLQAGWKWLFFEPGDFVADPARPEAWNRGAYLVNGLAHCGECHTPRNRFGAPDPEMALAGTVDGPEGEVAPNITPDRETGIGQWSEAELAELLRSKLKPDFDSVQGSMAETVDHGLKYLTDADLDAIVVYIMAQKPIVNRVRRGS